MEFQLEVQEKDVFLTNLQVGDFFITDGEYLYQLCRKVERNNTNKVERNTIYCNDGYCVLKYEKEQFYPIAIQNNWGPNEPVKRIKKCVLQSDCGISAYYNFVS